MQTATFDTGDRFAVMRLFKQKLGLVVIHVQLAILKNQVAALPYRQKLGFRGFFHDVAFEEWLCCLGWHHLQQSGRWLDLADILFFRCWHRFFI